eukprot:TRINITY_DN1163_c0_g1_i1.p1 TRINITY_DN1163_c0_g1~~TRINITY_DN1163_c0_g1_i1.p1  ORF type:complete len:294 (+),score=60.31 TRINITY_DN1163_c0_g1_i1:228-1109(+)
MQQFKILSELGEGTYGFVFRAQNINDNSIVALKKIKLDSEEEGVPSTAIREIALLKETNHPNIINLIDVIHTRRKLVLVFEHMDTDLRKFIDERKKSKNPLNLAECKLLLYQLIQGTHYLHQNDMLHRDLKPQNLMINRDRLLLKLGDFGLARTTALPVRSYTDEVVTLWYRAPEVLLGSTNYGCAIDMWSIGCIFAEMLNTEPLFPGRNADEQMLLICSILGKPTVEKWSEMTKLPKYTGGFPHYRPVNFASKFPILDDNGLDLLRRCLIFNPKNRITSSEALNHAFFDDIR